MVKKDDGEQPLWERQEVSRRGPDGVVTVYRCFRRLSDGAYSVQGVDRLSPPFDADQRDQLARQYWELLSEEEPDVRSGAFATLADAIEVFEDSFEQ